MTSPSRHESTGNTGKDRDSVEDAEDDDGDEEEDDDDDEEEELLLELELPRL